MEQEVVSGIVDEALVIFEQSAWAFLWTATAISLLALAFAAVERAVWRSRAGENGAAMMPQMGPGRTLGIALMVLGVGGVIACVAVWTVNFGDAGRWLTLLFKRMQNVTNGSEIAVLALSILSLLVFDYGVYKYLGSERSSPKADV